MTATSSSVAPGRCHPPPAAQIRRPKPPLGNFGPWPGLVRPSFPPTDLPDPRPAILDASARSVLLKTDRALVGRFQLVGCADFFAIDQDHGVRPINKDLEEKPNAILAGESEHIRSGLHP